MRWGLISTTVPGRTVLAAAAPAAGAAFSAFATDANASPAPIARHVTLFQFVMEKLPARPRAFCRPPSLPGACAPGHDGPGRRSFRLSDHCAMPARRSLRARATQRVRLELGPRRLLAERPWLLELVVEVGKQVAAVG